MTKQSFKLSSSDKSDNILTKLFSFLEWKHLRNNQCFRCGQMWKIGDIFCSALCSCNSVDTLRRVTRDRCKHRECLPSSGHNTPCIVFQLCSRNGIYASVCLWKAASKWNAQVDQCPRATSFPLSVYTTSKRLFLKFPSWCPKVVLGAPEHL